MKWKIIPILTILPISSIIVVSCSSSKSEELLNMFENTKDLNPLNTESQGYNISTLQVNIFKDMKDEDIFLFENVSSINSKTRYNRFVESFNSLTEIYKIKKDYWKPGMQFEFKVLENQAVNVNYIIVTYKKLVMNIRINFIRPYKVFSSIFYNKDNEFYIDKNNTIKITEDKKEYELDIYKQDNYKLLLEKEWIKPETKINLLADLYMLNEFIDNYEFNNSPVGFYNEWDLLLEENKIILSYQDYKVSYNLKVNDIIENLSKFVIFADDKDLLLFNTEKSSNWKVSIKKNPDINAGNIKLEDFAVQLAKPFNEVLIDESIFKLNDGDIYSSIKEEYREKIKITYKIDGQIVISLMNYSIFLEIKT